MKSKKTEKPDEADSKKYSAKNEAVFDDVAKPGTKPANPTSRPLIIGHGSTIAKDPMVKDDLADSEEQHDQDNKAESLARSKLKILPLSDSEEDEETSDNEQVEIDDAEDQPKSEDSDDKNKDDHELKESELDKADEEDDSNEEEDPKKAELDKDQETEEKVDEKTEASSSTKSSDAAAIDALAKEADAGKEKENAQKLAEQQEKIQRMSESKQFHVPIIEGGRKRSAERIAAWLLIFLLLVSVGVYLAVDAGYIDIGINLPIEFIKN